MVFISMYLICCCYLVAQLCLTLWDSMYCSLLGSSFHRISQTGMLEWVAISFSKGSSQPRDRTHIYIGRWILYHWDTWEAHVLVHVNKKKLKTLHPRII